MKASQHLKDLLEQWEGVRQQAYLDTGSEPTIGIGHLITKSERTSGKIMIAGNPIKYDQWLSILDCRALLAQDLKIPEKAVSSLVIVPLNQNQADALMSFIFNVGVEAFRNSTLLRLLNTGKYTDIPTQLRRWKYDNGKIVKGLISRREKEIVLWNEADVT